MCNKLVKLVNRFITKKNQVATRKLLEILRLIEKVIEKIKIFVHCIMLLYFVLIKSKGLVNDTSDIYYDCLKMHVPV